jgi:predicted MPP superfamily phosphohydrolase
MLSEVLTKSNIQEGNTFNILMTHQPISLEKLKDFPIDLEVAGHTHRGQIRGLSYLVAIVNDYGYGKYEENGRTAFITQGIGTRGLPVRLGTRSEIVMIHLQKA